MLRAGNACGGGGIKCCVSGWVLQRTLEWGDDHRPESCRNLPLQSHLPTDRSLLHQLVQAF